MERIPPNAQYSYLSNCYSKGFVGHSGVTNIGGLIGLSRFSLISYCYAADGVPDSQGGFLGIDMGNMYIFNGYYRENTGVNLLGTGIPVLWEQSFFTGFDFGNIWSINAGINNDTPYLTGMAP